MFWIVDQLPDLQRAVLHGVGEPMLVKNLPDGALAEGAQRLRVVQHQRHGPDRERGRAMIDAGLDELRVSLDAARCDLFPHDSWQELLQPHRDQRAQFSRASRTRRPRPAAGVRLADGAKETLGELAAFVQVAADIGVKEVYLQRLVFFADNAIGLASA